MSRFVHKYKNEIGLSPDQLVLQGNQRSDKVQIQLMSYNGTEFYEATYNSVSDAFHAMDAQRCNWLNIDGLHDEAVMRAMEDHFKLDLSLLSKVMDVHRRPSLSEYDDKLFFSLKMLSYSRDTEHIEAENISFIIMENTLITFQEQSGDILDPVRNRLRSHRRRIREGQSDYLAYALMDTIIDHALYTLGLIGEQIEEMDVVSDEISSDMPTKIQNFKRELSYVRKSVLPVQEIVLSLLKIDMDYLHPDLDIFLQDLKSNLSQLNDALVTYQEISSDMLNTYHTQVSNRLNEIMKFLTVFSVIFIPLTFIAGIYGTNFDFLPELHFRYAYFIMLGFMLLVAGIMVLVFKKKKWL